MGAQVCVHLVQNFLLTSTYLDSITKTKWECEEHENPREEDENILATPCAGTLFFLSFCVHHDGLGT